MDGSSPEADSVQGLSGEYEEALRWSLEELTSSAQVLLGVFSALLFSISWVLFMSLGSDSGSNVQIDFGAGELALGVVGIAITLALHELLHGLAMRVFGARPRYGMARNKIMLLLYATAPGHAFSRNRYVGICLAPLMGISALAVAGLVILKGTPWIWLLALCGATNGGGAIGDLWFFFKMLRYSREAYVVDEKDGFRVFLPADVARA